LIFASKEYVQEEGFEDVVAVVTEGDLVAAELAGDVVQDVAA
jgi:hypothetical protein